MFLVNSRFPLVCATPSSSGREVRHPNGVLLLPKLRRHFAEFLNHCSPNRLGILYLSTCVGLGYGHHMNSPLGFSRQHGINDFALIGSVSRLRLHEARICLVLALHAYPGTTIARDHLPSCVPLRLSAYWWVGSYNGVNARDSPLATCDWNWRACGGTGISTGCASTTPLGLALAPDSPWVD